MNARKITTEQWLYCLAFLLALALRLFQLGAATLTDAEAGWALQALNLAPGTVVTLGPQPAYLLLTSQLFNLFGDTNFMARLIPAVAGSLLIWLPFLLRRWMADSPWLHRAGLIMAFGLAIDPGLVSLSRQVGSPMPALAFSLLALACLFNRQMLGMGIFASLAMLSGPAFLQGLLILAVSWGLFRLAGLRFSQAQSDEGLDTKPLEPINRRAVALALAGFLGTLLVAGTLFLHTLPGLGALADTIPSFLASWVVSTGIPVLRLPASLLVYQPLVVIFGIIAIIHAASGLQDKPLVRQGMFALSLFAGVAILLPLLYAGRQVGDMAWALVPLWALAAIEISYSLAEVEDRSTRLIAAVLVFPLFVLAVFGWFNLLAINRPQVDVRVYWITLFGVLLVSVILVLLVATTWSTLTARLNLFWALCLVLGLQLLSNTWGMSILRQNGAQELWSPPPTISQAAQLNATLTDLSSWTTGLRDQLQIVSLVNSPALTWDLRDFQNARFETTLASNEAPPVVITLKEAGTPTLAQKYRGQDFIWRQYPGWQGVFPSDFINWLAFRQAPLVQDQIILWARVDIFPGGASSASGSSTP